MSSTTVRDVNIKKLTKEWAKIQREPIHNVEVRLDNDDLKIWFFKFTFSDGPYNGGEYIGQLMFPPQYPFKPPDFMMLTPNGRYDINHKICLSNTGFHSESWSASWTPSSLIVGFISTFEDTNKEITKGLGHIVTSLEEKHKYAENSASYNANCLPQIMAHFSNVNEPMEID